MTLNTELDPFAAAVQAAETEMTGGPDIETPLPDPQVETEDEAVEDQADPLADDEQAEEEGPPSNDDGEESEDPSDEEDELFADVEIEEPEEKPAEPVDLDSMTFELPGIDQPVSFQELRDGYLRTSDYTRKTQELAAQRKEADQAIRFWETFTKEPHRVAEQLAIQAGLIEEGATPVKVVDLPFRSEEDIQAEIDEKVEAALAEHPMIVEAQRVAGQRWIEDEFARIEETHSVTLGPKSRHKVLLKADSLGIDDLEAAFNLVLAEQQKQAGQRQKLQAGAPQRPRSNGTPTPAKTVEDVNSFEDAVKMAEAQMASSRR